jgi:Spy/CpxP family protein refolding chaperone
MSEDIMNANTAKRKAALWVATVFFLGVALGGVFGYFYASRVAAASKPPALSEPERRARRLDQLTHELNLSDSQRQQMDSLLLQIHNEYKSLREKNAVQLETEMDAARQKGRDQIRAVLTPEQKPKFEEFLRKLDEERKKNAAQQQSGPSQTPSSR